MSALRLFDWTRVPYSRTSHVAQWGHYAAFYRRRSAGAWEVQLVHSGRRVRHEELPAGASETDARAVAEQYLLDVQTPETRELARRMRAVQSADASTRSLRAVGGKRRHAKRGRKKSLAAVMREDRMLRGLK